VAVCACLAMLTVHVAKAQVLLNCAEEIQYAAKELVWLTELDARAAVLLE